MKCSKTHLVFIDTGNFQRHRCIIKITGYCRDVQEMMYRKIACHRWIYLWTLFSDQSIYQLIIVNITDLIN